LVGTPLLRPPTKRSIEYDSPGGDDDEDEFCGDVALQGAAGIYQVSECAGVQFAFQKNCCILTEPVGDFCGVCDPGQAFIDP
jgi:hypothetical protein